MLVGASGDSKVSEDYASLIASELAALGINIDFAPVADVNCNPANPIIGLRSFSSSPDLVSKMIPGALSGYKTKNIISSLKHFPGHGDTSVDSHQGLPQITKNFDELKKMELVPFAAGIKSGAEMIMTAHIQFPAIENETYKSISTGRQIFLPATLSKKIITGILRDDLKFDGVVITDAMDMGAVTSHFKNLDAAKLAINAGVDILLMACDISTSAQINYADQLISSLTDAVQSGEISESRIDESVKRILCLKHKYGILNWKSDFENQLKNAQSFVGSLENHQKEWAITEKGITVVKNENHLLPLKDSNQKIAILYPYNSENLCVKYALNYAKEKASLPQDITLLSYANKSFSSVFSVASKMDIVVIISELSKPAQFSQFFDSSSQFSLIKHLIENLQNEEKKVVLISAELPYDIAPFSQADAILAAYGAFEMKKVPSETAKNNIGYGPNIPVAIASIFGAANPNGRLPVDIFELDKNYNYTDKILFPLGAGEDF